MFNKHTPQVWLREALGPPTPERSEPGALHTGGRATSLLRLGGQAWEFLFPPASFGFASSASEREAGVDIVIVEWGCLVSPKVFQGHRITFDQLFSPYVYLVHPPI